MYSRTTHEVGFEVGPYDHDKPLVIDPVLVYSTHLGGGTLSDFFNRSAIAVDASGSAYVTGGALAFPTTTGAFQPVSNGDSEVFVAKLAPDGSGLVYSTFIGGSSYDLGAGIAVDADGRAYVTGLAFSTDFPTTPGAFQRTNGCTGFNCAGDAFVVKLNAEGSALVYSTYLGGRDGDHGYGIAIDGGGSAYVTGHAASSNFPVTPGTVPHVYSRPLPDQVERCRFRARLLHVRGRRQRRRGGRRRQRLRCRMERRVREQAQFSGFRTRLFDLSRRQPGSFDSGPRPRHRRQCLRHRDHKSIDFPVTPDAIQTAMQGIYSHGGLS